MQAEGSAINVSCLVIEQIGGSCVRIAEIFGYILLGYRVHIIIIENEPLCKCLDNSDIMTMVGATS